MRYLYARKVIIGSLVSLISLAIFGVLLVQARPLAAEFDCSAQSHLPTDQCEALVAIFNATAGENWINSEGWLQAPDPCSWHGVACSEGNVVALDLFGNNLTGALPIEIGGLPNLKTLTINGNPLSGPVPLTITFLDLDLFHFHNTTLCEPSDPNFQDWLLQIVYRLSSGIYCSDLQPTAISNIAQTQTAANLPWPQQTLTALASDTSLALGAATQEPTPTKYYNTQESPTQVISSTESQASSGDDTVAPTLVVDASPVFQEAKSFLSNIPRGWLIILIVPVILIFIGVLLEIRDRRREREERRPSKLEWGDIEERK